MQIQDIYKKINIGSANLNLTRKYPKVFIPMVLIPYDFVERNSYYFDYQNCVNDVPKYTGVPILTGGSGLYIDSVIYN